MATFGDLMTSSRPHPWGLRGDPLLWDAIKELLNDTSLPATVAELVATIEGAFEAITGSPISTSPDMLRVSSLKRKRGGMSNGVVSTVFWREKALPHLIAEYHKTAPQ